MKSAAFWITVNRRNESLYRQLELIPEPASFTSQLGQLWRQLIKFLSCEAEPHICSIADVNGQLWWQVYDPRTGRSIWFDSEQELRIWLENYR